jgi:hypothetical protein
MSFKPSFVRCRLTGPCSSITAINDSARLVQGGSITKSTVLSLRSNSPTDTGFTSASQSAGIATRIKSPHSASVLSLTISRALC